MARRRALPVVERRAGQLHVALGRGNRRGEQSFASLRATRNGNTRDRQGRLLTCEHGGRRVSRTEHDGRVVTLVDSFEGKKLNSPNDIVCKSDGSIWFTDPIFGILG